jgi:hypothetical protein
MTADIDRLAVGLHLWNRVLLRKLTVPQLVKTFLASIETRSNGLPLNLTLYQLNSAHTLTSCFNNFNIILPLMLTSQKWPLYGFKLKLLYAFLISPMSATFSLLNYALSCLHYIASNIANVAFEI